MLEVIPRLRWATWGSRTLGNTCPYPLGLPLPGGLSSYLLSHPLAVPPVLRIRVWDPKTAIPPPSPPPPGTQTCHMDASARTGTVTKRVTTPVALLLPCSVIYGTFPHLSRPADAGTMQGVPPHLPAFVRENHVPACVREHKCVHLGGVGGISWAFKKRC